MMLKPAPIPESGSESKLDPEQKDMEEDEFALATSFPENTLPFKIIILGMKFFIINKQTMP